MGINLKTGLFAGTIITVALLAAFYLDRKMTESSATVGAE